MFITPSYRLSHKKQQERCLVVTEGVFLKATTEAKKNKKRGDRLASCDQKRQAFTWRSADLGMY
jgi:hypothetical protein